MNRREFLRNAMISGAAVVAIGKTPMPALGVGSATPPPPATGMTMSSKRVSQAERAAAAARARAQREASGAVTNALYPNPWLPTSQPDYFGTFSNFANSQFPELDVNGNVIAGTGIRKFVDSLPGLNAAGANNLGSYIPVAVADTTTYPGSDYYVIGLVQYSQKMHSDLPMTLLRGYVQIETSNAAVLAASKHVALSNVNRDGSTSAITEGSPAVQVFAVEPPRYLGPLLIASKGRPVRVKFTNFLPSGAGGDLFIPTDTTFMGAGAAPGGQVTWIEITNKGSGYASAPTVSISAPTGPSPIQATAVAIVGQGINPAIAGRIIQIQITSPGRGYITQPLVTITGGGGTGAAATASFSAAAGIYKQNRATIHLHGGLTPWISDGTPHQWTVPANESTPYPKGVSVFNVPDMDTPGAGSMTFYYSNQQSARMMFYHDHSYGTTRLNVYAGEAGGYLLSDDIESGLINTGVLPAAQIPLIIQDKSFVPKPDQLAATDPTWDTTKYGGQGSLWFPHVYMPAQNPADLTGANAVGRWDYGPWCWPPVNPTFGPMANAYADPAQPWEPAKAPGVPFLSATPESFMDTMLVNGCVYPYVEVNPTSYRLRILNACNDRFVNLTLFEAASQARMWDVSDNTILLDGLNGEVPMVPAVATAGYPDGTNPADPVVWPVDYRLGGVPNPHYRGPDMIQYGSEGGFLPNPVVHHNQPLDLAAGRKNLFMAPAERADIVVDFTQFAGKTVILYNDSAAPVPGPDPRYDYYTGMPNFSAISAPNAWDANGGDGTGGAVGSLPGYAPNTRTIMQFRVGPAAVGGGPVGSVALTSGGTDYLSIPAVTIEGGGGNGSATAEVSGSVDAFSMLIPGSGYTAVPAVLVDVPRDALGNQNQLGIQATATALLRNGRVIGIQVTEPGLGYLAAPTVTIDPAPAGGVNAEAVSSLTLTGITLVSPGSAYISAPDVVFAGGGGYGAAGVANLANSAAEFNYANLVTAFNPGGTTKGAFALAQDDILIPQSQYDLAYGMTFPLDAFVRIQDTALTFTPMGSAIPVSKGLAPKCIAEEFTHDYGRLNALLGVEMPNSNFLNHKTIGYGYIDPATELITSTALGIAVGSLADGSQLWKITHNGVDTHVIHFHIVNVQVVNRVSWGGAISLPDANELGWKESVRVNPGEDCIVALRPVTPSLPFKVPNSYRLMDVTKPIGSTADFLNIDPLGQARPVSNAVKNFGWEYVWHCHILEHEENDMMRPILAAVPPEAPTLTAVGSYSPLAISLSWVNNSLNTTGWSIQKKLSSASSWSTLVANLPVTTLSYTDSGVATLTSFDYRVVASNLVGTTYTNFPNTTVTSISNVASVAIQVPPNAPASVTATQGTGTKNVSVVWTAPVGGPAVSGYRLYRRISPSSTYTLVTSVAATTLSYADTTTKTAGVDYTYGVIASNAAGSSGMTTSNILTVI